MAEPFKNLIGAGLVHDMSRHLGRVAPSFDSRRFEAMALSGLDALEMKARAHQICDALEATLPERFDDAARVIEASLAPAPPAEDLPAPHNSDAGLAGWAIWPLGEYVARRGMQAPERALAVLHALTQRFSAEFAIRPFIARHPQLSFETLQRWVDDPSPHVRRLVSEGSRPRLPWGMRLKGLVADPSPTLPLLERLQHDPSDYVRRSVANHLNDIAKDHPALVVDWVSRHLKGASPALRTLLKHASRTLIKSGDPRMLKAWGLGRRFAGRVGLKVAPKRIKLGDSVVLDVTLTSDAPRAQTLVIDYAVHHVKANGGATPKVFKGWALELDPHETRTLRKTHSLRAVTTRRYHAGRHELDLRVNGEVVASGAFDLRL
jgi:3-methyladenine DNA glycosylase AlkC